MEMNGLTLYDQKKSDESNSKKRKLDQPSSSKISSLSQKKIKSHIDEVLNCTPFEVSDGKDKKITSLLHQLVFLNNLKMIKKIARDHLIGIKPVCIDVKDSWGNTPLMLACLKENFEAAFLLLLAGGDPCLENSDGLSAFDFALESKSPILARLLLNFANSPSEKIAQKFVGKNMPFNPLDDTTIRGCLTSIMDPENTNIHDLPFEVLLKIFSFLPEKAIFSILNVSKEWRELSKDNALLKNLLKPYPYIQLPEQSNIQIYDWLKIEFNRLKNHPYLQDKVEFQKYGNIFSLPFLNTLKERETEIETQEICTRCEQLAGFEDFRVEAEALCKQDKLALFKALKDWEHLDNLEKLCKKLKCLPKKKDATYHSKNRNEKLEILQEKICQIAPTITSLDMGEGNLTMLPPEIGQFTKLEKLNLSGNRLTGLPPEIGNLTELKELELHYNLITQLPTEIGKLTNLERLDLFKNQLTSLPPEISNLTKLERLGLLCNQLSHLPSKFDKLIELKELILGGNQLETLPPEIGRLTKLKKLSIFQNRLRSLPDIGGLTDLERLILSDNQLETLPSEIGKLTKLKELPLYRNRLTSLPSELGELTKLEELSLSENQLTNLSFDISKLTKLNNLDLSNNQLKSLPPEIGKLTNLENLNFLNNRLINLPPDFGNLTKLKELNLCNNKLRDFPPEFGNLTKLKELNLCNNKLRDLPPEFDKLTNLEKLDLGNNKLKDLPPEIGKLTNLEKLYLFENQLTSLPAEISELSELKELRLTENQLTNLSFEIDKLIKLKVLDLDKNQLTSLPAEISELSELKELRLHSNNLDSLPVEICNFRKLRVLNVDGNPLKNVSALLNSDNPIIKKALKNYFNLS